MPFGFLALLAAFGALANSSPELSTHLNRLRRFPLQGTTPAARQSRFRGAPGRGCAALASPRLLVRCAHLAGVGLPHSSTLTSRKGTARRAPTPSPLTPHFSSWATTRVAPTPSPFKDSGRTQTSSFRAQSRNPCPPALQLGCCDYAQHDGVCRAPLPPSPTPFPVFPHPSLLGRARHAVPLHQTPHSSSWTTTRVAPTPSPFKDSGRTQTSSFRAQSRNPCPPALQLGCCDYAQHDGVCRAPLPPSPTPFPVFPHSSLLARARHAVPLHQTPHSSLLIMGNHKGCPYTLTPHPSKTAAEPKLRHSARSRGIHVPLHSNLDAATTRSMTACTGHRCPLHPHHSPSFLTPHFSQGHGTPCPYTRPLTPHFSSWATTRVAPTPSPFKDSGRTQTSSFRAQSRNPCFPALQHRCCDYAQHDGVYRAPLPPSPTPFPVFPHPSLLARARHAVPLHQTPHSSLLIMGNHKGCPYTVTPHPSKTAAVPKLRHSAHSRGIHVPLHSNIDAATTRSMTACVGHRCPLHPLHSPSFLTPMPLPKGNHKGCPYDLSPHSSLLCPHPRATTRVAPTTSALTPHS